jgi:hypothetical protein
MSSKALKESIYQYCTSLLTEKRKSLELQIHALRQDLQSESKSTAGDKHETGRAMLQLEMEKLGARHLSVQRELQLLERINTSRESDTLQSGSLALINGSWFFVSIGLGKIDYQGIAVFCLAPSAPLAQSILGKRLGEKAHFRGKTLHIEELW